MRFISNTSIQIVISEFLIDSVSLHLFNFESEEEVAAIDRRLKELEERLLKLEVEIENGMIQED